MKLKDVFNAVIGIAGLALSLGMVIVAIAIASALISHGWPQGDWALSWTALSAIGGLAAGFGAFYAARVAIKIAEQQEQKENSLRRVEAEIASFSLATRLRLITNQLKECLQKNKANELENLGSEVGLLISLIESLDDHDIRRFSYLSVKIAYEIAEAKSYIKDFYEKAYASNEILTRDIRAAIFLRGANGHQRLESYLQIFDGISQEMFRLNSSLR